MVFEDKNRLAVKHQDRNMFAIYPDVLTVNQVAKALGIGKNKAYELINNHVISSRRIGRRILIPKICLVDFIESIRYADNA